MTEVTSLSPRVIKKRHTADCCVSFLFLFAKSQNLFFIISVSVHIEYSNTET